MKKVLIIFALLLTTTTVFSQAFSGKGSSNLFLGIGLNVHTTKFSSHPNLMQIQGWNTTSYFALNGHYEYGVHKYIGVGASVGLEFAGNMHPRVYYHNVDLAYGGFAIPIGVFGNFHFLQLIADNANKSFAEKLDVYAGISLGTGVSIATVKSAYKNHHSSRVGALFFGGTHVGVRYLLSDNFGVYGELGYGKNVINLGVTLKL